MTCLMVRKHHLSATFFCHFVSTFSHLGKGHQTRHCILHSLDLTTIPHLPWSLTPSFSLWPLLLWMSFPGPKHWGQGLYFPLVVVPSDLSTVPGTWKHLINASWLADGLSFLIQVKAPSFLVTCCSVIASEFFESGKFHLFYFYAETNR